jgi:hypothetical protein
LSLRYPYSPGGAAGVLDAVGVLDAAGTPGVTPYSGRGRNGSFLDYCSRDILPPVGGLSRNRETMFSG